MTQEEKQLLLQDLCARLPYGCRVFYEYVDKLDGKTYGYSVNLNTWCIDELEANKAVIKPYLRPMSSMTEEECVELSKIRPFDDEVEAWKYIKTPVPLKIANIKHFDFFHSHHLDWRGLIEKGLAIEAPEGMYNN